jgi:gamma-glutamylcyclotransferase (GGCT)/AIG2-like uncharacterized protein YtfP
MLKIYNQLELTQEVLDNVKTTGTPVELSFNKETEYFLVYGTLRLFGSNWNWSLKESCEHVQTMELKGFKKDNGIACMYTGDGNDYTVVDLFKAKEETDLSALNDALDSLEGSPEWYNPLLIPVQLENGETILAKFYEMKWDRNSPVEHDIFANRVGLKKQSSGDLWKEKYPNSYKFYFPEEFTENNEDQEVVEEEVV